MNQVGFDSEQVYRGCSPSIFVERISQFGGKLYLEFGGKLFDDYHASRVLPGFAPDSKIKMLLHLRDQAEIVIAINADDIEKNKRARRSGHHLRCGRAAPDRRFPRLRAVCRQRGADAVCAASLPRDRCSRSAWKRWACTVYRHYPIPKAIPPTCELIVSDEGYGRNDYIETTRPLVRGDRARARAAARWPTCLSQLYHEHKRGVKAGYAKFETFPIWNLPLKHPVNLAYEAATADLNDVNMIDPFHLEAYGETTVNYNRDIEIFPVLQRHFRAHSTANRPYKIARRIWA